MKTRQERFHHAALALGARLVAPLALRAETWGWLGGLPSLPRRDPAPAVWDRATGETPPSLRTVPGIWRDPAVEEAAYADEPLHDFRALHPEASSWAYRHGAWTFLAPSLVRRHRAMRWTREVEAANRSTPPPVADPEVLSGEVRAEASRLGISTVGFTPFDPKYIFAEYGPYEEGSVIVCVAEQSWERTQQIPSIQTERSVTRLYEDLSRRACDLAAFLQAKGFRAQVQTYMGEGALIAYAQQAGLGQMGLNGQLLTPQAGSRCRLLLMATNARLVHGGPVDYGVHAICDACQVCVKRCPPGAIPIKRTEHRGIVKAKIKPERCLPVVVQAHGCAVCMKVCPVQRHGIDAVKDHYLETGEILGKGSDELEGYDWIDGRHYGPGEKPRINSSLVSPPGFRIDPKRTRPPAGGTEPPASG